MRRVTPQKNMIMIGVLVLTRICTADVALTPSNASNAADTAASFFQKRIALVFGNDTAGEAFSVLKYVKNDLAEFADILVQNCGFRKNTVISRHNPKKSDIRRVLDSLRSNRSNIGVDDFFLMYYSGHADTAGLLMGFERFAFKELKELLDSLPFRMQVYILDACHSGTFSVSAVKGGSIDTSFLPPKVPGQMRAFATTIKGKALVYSCRSDQVSAESDVYKHSIFTYHLLSGLRGAAQTCIRGFSRISLNDLYIYVLENIRREPNTPIRQVPGIDLAIKGEGDIILASFNDFHPGVAFDDQLLGDLFIFDRSENFVAKIAKKDQNKMLYSLKQGIYKIIFRDKYAILQVRAKGRMPVLTRNDFTNDERNTRYYGFLASLETAHIPHARGTFPNAVGGALSAELIWKNQYRCMADAGYSRFRQTTMEKLPQTGIPYEKIVSVPTFLGRLGAGCRSMRNPLHYLWLTAGAEARYERYTVQLKSAQGIPKTKAVQKSVYLLPYAGMDFRKKASPYFDYGATFKVYANSLMRIRNLSHTVPDPHPVPHIKNMDLGLFMSFLVNRF